MSGRAVECECGELIPVTAGVPGPLRCRCGRPVVVPLPEEFDGPTVLLSAATVERRVQRLLGAGHLPAGRGCACCGSPRAGVLDVRVLCEASESRLTGGHRFLIIPGLFSVSWYEERRLEVLGRDNVIRTPVRSCDRCARRFRAPPSSALGYVLAAGALGALAFGLTLLALLVGWVALIPVGACALGAVALLLLMSRQRRAGLARWQGRCKAVLADTPAYAQLLREYPHATVLLARRAWLDEHE